MRPNIGMELGSPYPRETAVHESYCCSVAVTPSKGAHLAMAKLEELRKGELFQILQVSKLTFRNPATTQARQCIVSSLSIVGQSRL